MSATAYWVRLGGWLPATEIAPHSPPSWETLASGGIGEVSFEFALSPKAQHQLLTVGTKVEVMLGAQAVATSLMSEPDRTEWAIKAQGLSAASRNVAAVNSLGEFTRDVGQVLLNVTTQGWWPVTNPFGVGAGKVVAGDATGPLMVGELLDQLAEQEGKRWGVDGAGRIYMRPDPTVATCVIAPEAAAFGVTDEGRATQLVGRYVDAGGVGTTRIYPPTVNGPIIHEVVDLTDAERYGALSEAQVDAILSGAFSLGKAETNWTNGVTLDREQITRRGVPAVLPTLTAGVDMARATGMSSGYLSAPWLDVVIGKTRYTAGERSIYLEPVSKAPRTFTEVIAAS